ncbi:MAG: hypothetical protein ACI9EF_001256 [Pseudohongiellaceae bacterium]|jgi:hypothetical protein
MARLMLQFGLAYALHRVGRHGLGLLCLAVLGLLGSCAAPEQKLEAGQLTPVPPWTEDVPRLEGGRWVAPGRATAATIDEAEGLAAAAARAALLSYRAGQLDDALPAGSAPRVVDSRTAVGKISERIAALDARDSLTMFMPTGGERFVRRLGGDTVQVFVQASVDDLKLFPQRRLHEAATLSDPEERSATLIHLARTLLLRGMDAHSQAALALIERDGELSPTTLLELSGLHLLLGRRDEALVANTRALEKLEPLEQAEPNTANATLLARAREQQARLLSGIAAIEELLLDLERLTRASRHEEVLSTPETELFCDGTHLTVVHIVFGSDPGRLVPLWLDQSGVRLVNLSNDGRASGMSMQLSVALAPGIESATLLLWLIPEDLSVLEIVDSMRGRRLPSDDASASDDERLLLQGLLDGLRKASTHGGVGGLTVHVQRAEVAGEAP